MQATKQQGSIGELAREGLWSNNPVFRQVLGICSTLAVTNMVLNTMVMCAALVVTLALSSLTLSLMRNGIPRSIRMMVETLVIAFYVIVFDRMLQAWWPAMSRDLGPYVGLIITNCIIMGRAEACAMSQPPGRALWDGIFNGLGYSLVLLLIAIPREVLGTGAVMGYPVPFFSGAGWDPWIIMVMPPGAFFMLAIAVWVFRTVQAPDEEVK